MTKGRNITIGVDGGVNLDTISKVYDTGIDITIVGSALFKSDNISQRYQDLMNAWTIKLPSRNLSETHPFILIMYSIYAMVFWKGYFSAMDYIMCDNFTDFRLWKEA